LGGLAGGTLFGPGFWMGFGGAVASSLVMATGAKLASGARSNVVISIAGAIAHSTAQVMVAFQLMRHPGLWGYWPFLTLASSVTGFFIGLVCDRSLSLVTRNIAPERKPQCV
jgi:heptaprenyl diphosphate synthase